MSGNIDLVIIGIYLLILLGLGIGTSFLFKGTAKDYFLASHSIGPVLLLMSVFGTTMTAFAMVGSTAKTYDLGIGVYGLMASWSGLIHSAVFFLVGIKVWAIGKRYGFTTQCQFFRDRFQSPALGYLLFPVLVLLIIPYLLTGLLGANAMMTGLTLGRFADLFGGNGAIPPWITSLVICFVVLTYVFLGGVRSTAWANTFQTIVFMVIGVLTIYLISKSLGGFRAASQAVLEHSPEHLTRDKIGKAQFFSYCFIPLSVGMFPHLFQHWLTARSAKTFRLTVICHPIFIMLVWVPCIMIGIWAAGYAGSHPDFVIPPGRSNIVLSKMVGVLVHNEILTGLVTAGVLAAIMSSLDSQFLCLGTMFTNDVAFRLVPEEKFTDKQKVLVARAFIVFIVAITYGLTFLSPPNIFDLGVWCFTGFGSLFPLIFAAVYWKRTTKAGAIASVLTTIVLWFILFLNDMSAKAAARAAGGMAGDDELLIFGMMPVMFIFAGSLVSLIVVSLITKPPSDATIDKFFPKELKNIPS